jgi:ArsR family transcriptional regulator
MCTLDKDYKKRLEHVRSAMPSQELIYEVAELFKVCGDSTRVGILCVLIGSEFRVSDIADLVGMSTSAISHQLRILKHLRIVKSRREGKYVFYSLADRHIEDIFRTAFDHIVGEYCDE